MSRAPGNLLATYLAFCLALRSLCAMHRVSVVSWWRSNQHNAAVDGLENSRHLDGIGADLELDDDVIPDHVERSARMLGLQVDRTRGKFHVEMDPT